jgi:hypothetical protein
MKIPCEQCPILAICRLKQKVLCDILARTADKIPVNKNTKLRVRNAILRDWWKTLHKQLPELRSIKYSNGEGIKRKRS